MSPRPRFPSRRAALFLGCVWISFAARGEVGMKVAGDWAIEIGEPGAATPTRLEVAPATVEDVRAERIETLPLYNPKAGGWGRGVQLRLVRAQETTTPYLLEPESLVLRRGADDTAPALEAGKDFEADRVWGTVGRLESGSVRPGEPVFASYRCARLRIDSVVRRPGGGLAVRTGIPASAAPSLPALEAGETRLANLWLPGRLPRLGSANLFPITEAAYPEPPKADADRLRQRLPKSIARLESGGPLRVLAWGDSVTDGGYVPDPSRNRWQEQFAARLRARYPAAKIELVTEAWGGRSTESYLAEPPGSAHNYREKVLGAKPDLVVSEFVNDAGLNPAQVDERYGRFLADFRARDIEWIILTPHYVRPDWMGLDRERDIDRDPRPYVAGLRAFAAREGVALGDASLRYGRLWRQGIPYTALMLNSINHPDARGMAIFADALMELFP